MQKMREKDGVKFFFCGATSDFETFIDAWFGEVPDKSVDASALVISEGKIYLSSISDENELWKESIEDSPCYAIGSGSPFALTAMDMGADAATAVKMAAKRDKSTGGKIRTYKVK